MIAAGDVPGQQTGSRAGPSPVLAVEGIPQVVDPRDLARTDLHADEIEPKLATEAGVASDPGGRRPDEIAALRAAERVERVLGAAGRAGLHLDERHDIPLLCHDVDLAATGSPVAVENPQTRASEMAHGQLLAVGPQATGSYPGCHQRPASTSFGTAIERPMACAIGSISRMSRSNWSGVSDWAPSETALGGSG